MDLEPIMQSEISQKEKNTQDIRVWGFYFKDI